MIVLRACIRSVPVWKQSALPPSAAACLRGPARRLSTDAKPQEADKPAAEGEAATQPSVEESLKLSLSEKDKQISDLQDQYRRALADMENIRQRTKKEVENASDFAITKFAKDLLDTADVLEIALKNVPEAERSSDAHKSLKDFYSGVSMTHGNLLKSLKRFGVEPYAAELGAGAKFDHNLHEAIFRAPVPNKEPGSILEVIKKGYMIKGRVLRNAQVGVVQESN